MRERLSRMKTESENSLNKRNKYKEELSGEVNEASTKLKLASDESAQKSSLVLLDEFSKAEGQLSGCSLELSDSRRQLESILDEARIGTQHCNVSLYVSNRACKY